MWCQPVEGIPKAEAMEVDEEIDGAATADALVPVDELGAGDGEDAPRGVPLVWVAGGELSAAGTEDVRQGDRPERVSFLADRRAVHRRR